jgi:hypothetical protein
LGTTGRRIEIQCAPLLGIWEAIQEIRKLGGRDTSFVFVLSASTPQSHATASRKMFESRADFLPNAARVLTVLKDNVNIPAFLRAGEWIDFREESAFETGVQELVTFVRESPARRGARSAMLADSDVLRQDSQRIVTPVSSRELQGKERIVSNLFPLLETPGMVFSAETACRTDAEVIEACGGPGPVPFLLQDSRLYSFQPFTQDSLLRPAVRSGAQMLQENFTRWLSSSDRAVSALSLLDSLFRHHAWKRGLRYDKGRRLYYFTRSKPKSIVWQMGPETVAREVTAPDLSWIRIDDRIKAEVQYGWRHLAVRAGFVQLLGTLFLQLEPTWHLTMLDGKTAATSDELAPRMACSHRPLRNGQVLRSLRFWSVVLTKGHQELRINTGSNPLRSRLTPLSGFSRSGPQDDLMDYDRLMLAESKDDLCLPELGTISQESSIHHEEDISSESLGNFRGEQPQARS